LRGGQLKAFVRRAKTEKRVPRQILENVSARSGGEGGREKSPTCHGKKIAGTKSPRREKVIAQEKGRLF